jgi:hypothetical protein
MNGSIQAWIISSVIVYFQHRQTISYLFCSCDHRELARGSTLFFLSSIRVLFTVRGIATLPVAIASTSKTLKLPCSSVSVRRNSSRPNRGQGGPLQQHLVTAELHMGHIVNLRTARKQAKRRRAEQEAARNRLVRGRSKSERSLQGAQSDKARKDLEQHRIERGDG